ncbi:unnamed protein product [Ectocarpus fasciculatus]
MFPQGGHSSHGNTKMGFGAAVSVLLYRFDLWLKGSSMRPYGKAFERAEDDEDTFGKVHCQHAQNKARAERVCVKGAKRTPRRRRSRGLNVPRVASPTSTSTRPALTPATAAAIIVRALNATKGEEPEWKTSWAKYEAQLKKKESKNIGSTTHMEKKCMMGENYKIGENKTIDVGIIPASPTIPLRMPTPLVCKKSGKGQETHPTPTITPLSDLRASW